MTGKGVIKNAVPGQNTPVSYQLPPTKTFGWRRLTWTRYTQTGYLVFGVLQIDEARREGLKATTSRYAVSEYLGDGGRCFRVAKPIGQGGERQFVLLGGNYDECTCTGHEKQGRCKHASAMRLLYEQGQLPRVTKLEGGLRRFDAKFKLPKSKKDPKRGR